MTATTRTSVTSIVICTSLNDSRILRERSCRVIRCTEGGNCASRDGSNARTALVTAITLVPGCLRISSVTARCRFVFVYNHARCVMFSTLSMTLATCSSRTGRPSAIRDDEGPECLRGVEEPVGTVQQPVRIDGVGAAAEQHARRGVDVPVLQRLVDLVDADLFGAQLVRISPAREPRTSANPARPPATRRPPSRCVAPGGSGRNRRPRHLERARYETELEDGKVRRVDFPVRRRRRQRRRQQRHRGGNCRLPRRPRRCRSCDRDRTSW